MGFYSPDKRRLPHPFSLLTQIHDWAQALNRLIVRKRRTAQQSSYFARFRCLVMSRNSGATRPTISELAPDNLNLMGG